MSVRLKLVTIVLFVALVPVSIAAYTMLRVHRASFGATLEELHQRTAELGAARSQRQFDHSVDVLSALIRERIDWPALTESERTQVLWLIYEQLDSVVVASLRNERGDAIGPSVYRAASSDADSLLARPIMRRAELQSYADNLPAFHALETGFAVGVAVPPTANRGATIPLAFSVSGGNGETWVVGVGISLTRMCQGLVANRATDTGLALLDRAGSQLCAGLAGDAKLGASLLAELPLLTTASRRYDDEEGQEVLASAAPAGPGWTMVSTQLVSTAFAASRRLQHQVIFWIAFGVIAALVAGLFLARSITRPIARLSHATRQIAAGTYDVQLAVEGRDEFAQLSDAFNTMSAEIRQWNAELVHRVAEQTQALTEAQSQLLESRKMAAVAAMSAGIAHEINNPLTAVITFAQVLESRAGLDPAQEKQARMLGKLAQSALRIRDIVERMQRLTADTGQGMSDQLPMEIIRAATAELQSKISEAGILVVIDEQDPQALIYVHRFQLQHALVHIMDNAIKAMQGDRRTLTFSTRNIESKLLQIEIADTGKGIPLEAIDKIFEPFFTLKGHWEGQGLGLTEAHQIISSNNGTVKVRSNVGEGTTMTLLFPVAGARAHLI